MHIPLTLDGLGRLLRMAVLTLTCSLLHPVPIDSQQPTSGRPRLVVQIGHLGSILDVKFSPDGRRVLTGGSDSAAKVWEVASGRELLSLYPRLGLSKKEEGFSRGIDAVAFSPDGMHMLTGSGLKITLWDSGGHSLKTFSAGGDVKALAFNTDGQQFLSGDTEGKALLWDIDSRKILKKFQHRDFVTSVAFAPDGEHVLTGSREQRVRMWRIDSERTVMTFDTDWSGGSIDFHIALSKNGKILLASGADLKVRLWSMDSGKLIREFQRKSTAEEVSMSSDGQKIFIASGSFIQIWDVQKTEPEYSIGGFKEISGLAISEDGRNLFVGSASGAIRIWDLQLKQEIVQPSDQGMPIHTVAFSPDGGTILLGGDRRTAFIWDISSGRESVRLPNHLGRVGSAAFSSDGQLVVTGSYDSGVRLWNVETGKLVRYVIFPNSNERGGMAVAFSPDGKQIAAGAWHNLTSQVQGLETGAPIIEIRHEKDLYVTMSSLAFSPDGRSLVTVPSFGGGVVRLWSLGNGQELQRFYEKNLPQTESVAFAPGGKEILTSHWDGTARLWDVRTGRQVRVYRGHQSLLSSAIFSPDGAFILTGSWDGTARLWNRDSAAELQVFRGHTREVTSIAFNPNGKTVLTGSGDGTARLWDKSSGKELCALVSFFENGWVVVSPEGFFDTNNLDAIDALHWVFGDDPSAAIPAEIFLREFYKPRLLQRLLSGEILADKRLEDLNRIQPEVHILNVTTPSSSEPYVINVDVEVAENREPNTPASLRSGAYDLRLFRDGRLVGMEPVLREEDFLSLAAKTEKQDWRNLHQIDLESNGRARKRFRVTLPRTASLKDVELSAYAFNRDRVKSATDRRKVPIPPELTPVRGRAFLVAVGVAGNQNWHWRTSYGAKDARLLQDTLGEALKSTYQVVPIPLVSGRVPEDKKPEEILPTKAYIRTVLRWLAGKELEPNLLSTLPRELRDEWMPVRPEDLIVFSFSGHGNTDDQGNFSLYPYDLGLDDPVPSDRLITSEELAFWLLDLDAGEIIVILDACRSGAAVGPDFRPAPLGEVSLGQFAYDKGIRLLAATQFDQAAIECASLGGHGLLTYALALAGRVTAPLRWRDWLREGERRVPKLYVEKACRGRPKDERVQRASLFDFARERRLPSTDR